MFLRDVCAVVKVYITQRDFNFLTVSGPSLFSGDTLRWMLLVTTHTILAFPVNSLILFIAVSVDSFLCFLFAFKLLIPQTSFLIIIVGAHVTYTLVLKRKAAVQIKDTVTQRPTTMSRNKGKGLLFKKNFLFYIGVELIYTVVLVSGVLQRDLVIRDWLLNRWMWMCIITNYRGIPHPWVRGSSQRAINWSENIYCCYLRVFQLKGLSSSSIHKKWRWRLRQGPCEKLLTRLQWFSDIDTDMIMGSPRWKHSFQLPLVLLFWRLNFPRWDAKSFLSLHVQGF